MKHLIVTLGLFLVISCATTKPGNGYFNDVPDAIQQLISKQYSNDLYAIGTAKDVDEGRAIRQATLQARVAISKQFETNISALRNSYENKINDQTVDKISDIIDELTHIKLKGSKVIKSMIRPEKDGYYTAKVLVIVSSEQLKSLIDQQLRDYTEFKFSEEYRKLMERLNLE